MIYAKIISAANTQSGNPKYRATFVFEDQNGKKLSGALTVEANNKTEFKDKLRPLVKARIAADNQNDQLKALAQEALSEVIVEETGA